jgi:hypothetical protein
VIILAITFGPRLLHREKPATGRGFAGATLERYGEPPGTHPAPRAEDLGDRGWADPRHRDGWPVHEATTPSALLRYVERSA